jgi:hypothetical protein
VQPQTKARVPVIKRRYVTFYYTCNLFRVFPLEAPGVAATKACGMRQSNGSLLNVGFGVSVTGSLLLPLVVVIDLHQLSFQNNAEPSLPMLNAARITASLLDKVLGYR